MWKMKNEEEEKTSADPEGGTQGVQRQQIFANFSA